MAEMRAIPSASASALTSLRGASNRLDSAAATISATGAIENNDTVSLSTAARNAGQHGNEGGNEGGDFPQAVVDLRVARYQASASIAVLRTVDAVSRDLLDIVRR
jgi:hypothetical protein